MSFRLAVRTARFFSFAQFIFVLSALSGSAQQAVTTYHYDNNRSGWNQHETQLTPATVASRAFGRLMAVGLDDQVDAQPLVVPGLAMSINGIAEKHDVVFVVTANNSVYAIDTDNGRVLLKKNFGAPVLYPLGCTNNGPNVGMTSTPVIDMAAQTMYVMAYNQDADGPVYKLHALDLATLTDKVAPRIVAATHHLANGRTSHFNATYQRQRPALLLANGNVYAGFGSFCDFAADQSRGWLLGWRANSLTPLATNQLLNMQAGTQDKFYLSSIWMSGYGPVADAEGNVLFVTGNSDYNGATYDGVTNLQESVVKVSPDLSSVLDIFTPMNQVFLDLYDADFGSGGVMLLPEQQAPATNLAVAAGKDGTMYLMNENFMGGYSPFTNNVLGTYPIGPCWCGPSYYVGSDGVARIVSSGGNYAQVWKVQVTPTPGLTQVGTSNFIMGLGSGFFTSVSSSGTEGTIIWAVSRFSDGQHFKLRLHAYDPNASTTPMKALNKIRAGIWPNVGGLNNTVPVVANGKVFVASYRELQIFGLTPAATGAVEPAQVAPREPSDRLQENPKD